MKLEDITLGVSSKGNTEALQLCLSSVLLGSRVPGHIQIRLEGDLPGFNSFYLEQLAALAAFKGVSFRFAVCPSTGVRDSRDWQISHCRTNYLWMVDDDVVVDHDCLAAYDALSLLEFSAKHTYWAGSKGDVNNRRSYPVFEMKEFSWSEAQKFNNHSFLYNKAECWGKCVPSPVLDTGNVLFYLPPIKRCVCRFQLFAPDDRFNPSGDATTFSLVLAKAGLTGSFVPSARAYHLEKQGGGFNEFQARGEMLLRLCESKGFDKSIVKEYFMPSNPT